MIAKDLSSISGDDGIYQHLIPTEKLVPQESEEDIFFLCNNKMISDTHTRKADNQIHNKYGATSAYSSRVVEIC